MGRAAITVGTSDGRPSILDRSGDGTIRLGQEADLRSFPRGSWNWLGSATKLQGNRGKHRRSKKRSRDKKSS